MSQSRDPRRKGKDSKAKTKPKSKSRNLMAQKGSTKPSVSSKKAKSSPQESPQVVEMRRKVNLVYLLILATCGVVIVVFALLVANKLSTAGIISDPEESGLLQASMPGETTVGETTIDETATGTTTPTSNELETGETDPTESDANDTSGTTSKTAPVKVGGPVTRRTYSYGNVNIEGGLDVVTTKTTPTTGTSDNEDGEGETAATGPATDPSETTATDPPTDPPATDPPAPDTGAGGGDDGSTGGGSENDDGSGE